MAGDPKNGDSDDEAGVLGNLPSTRPSRMSRRARPEPGAVPAPPAPARKKPKPKPAATAAGRKPRAVRQASPALERPAAQAQEQREEVVERPGQSGTQLVGTVVQAAGELASIGLTIGGQILKRASSKLPRP